MMLNLIDDFIDLLEYWLNRSIKLWLVVLAVMVIYNFLKTQGV